MAQVDRARRRWRVKQLNVSPMPGQEGSGQPRWKTYRAEKCLSATWRVSWASIHKQIADPDEVERLVIARLAHRRTLIVLDNVETLVEAVEANNEEAIRLAQFLREQLPRPPVSLLATSRSFLGWTGEIGCELTGLAPIEGVRLFSNMLHSVKRR